jgi:hypothetical protein
VQVVGVYCSANAFYSVGNPTPRSLTVQFAGGPLAYGGAVNSAWAMNNVILGPCTMTLTATATNNSSPAAYAVLQYLP